jgi:hypothetical protein
MSSPLIRALIQTHWIASTCALVAHLGHAQVPPPAAAPAPPTPTIADKIVREALSHGRAYALLETLCTVAPHRLAGSSGAAEAVRWAKDEMARAGLENVHL